MSANFSRPSAVSCWGWFKFAASFSVVCKIVHFVAHHSWLHSLQSRQSEYPVTG